MASSVVATAMKSRAAMEASAISVEFTATIKLAATTEAAAPKAFIGESAASKTVMIPAAVAEAVVAPAIMIPVAVPCATVVAPAIEAGMTVIPVVPRAHANEYTVYKPLRPVITVGRAGVRVIIIITIGTNRGWTDVSRANSYANDHSLCAGKRSAKQANAE